MPDLSLFKLRKIISIWLSCLSKHSERFKLISYVYALKAHFHKSMNHVDMLNFFAKIFDKLIAVVNSLVKMHDDWVKLFLDEFPSRRFSTATIQAYKLTTSMLLEMLKRNMQRNDTIKVNGLWETGVIISTFPDSFVLRQFVTCIDIPDCIGM